MVPGEAQALADAIKRSGFDERYYYRPDRPHNRRSRREGDNGGTDPPQILIKLPLDTGAVFLR